MSDDPNILWKVVLNADRVGPEAVTPAVVEALTRLLACPDRSFRYAAAWVIPKLCQAPATPEVIEALTRLVDDEHKDICQAAARALVYVGDPATVLRLLQHEDRGVRREVANAIAEFGRPAGPEVSSALLDLVRSETGLVAIVAGQAFVRIAPSKADAALALAQVGTAPAIQVVRDLARELGQAVATPELASLLARILEGEETAPDFSLLVSEAITRLAPATVTPEVIQAMIIATRRCCRHGSCYVTMFDNLKYIVAAANPQALENARGVLGEAIEQAEFSIASALLAGQEPLEVDTWIPNIARAALSRLTSLEEGT